MPGELAGQVALQAAADFATAFAFDGSALDVLLRCGVAASVDVVVLELIQQREHGQR